MDRPYCEVVGCDHAACWVRCDESEPMAEEYLCAEHYDQICKREAGTRKGYRPLGRRATAGVTALASTRKLIVTMAQMAA